MKKMRRRSQSLFFLILIPVLLLTVAQAVLFYGVTVYGGVIGALDNNAEDIMAERVINRGKELRTHFTNDWLSFSATEKSMNALYHALGGAPALRDDPEEQKTMLAQAAPMLIQMLRTNGVNGVFLILNNEEDYSPLEADEKDKIGICIRDYDVNSAYTANEDLLVVRCPSSAVKTVGCSLETWWEALYSFDEQHPGNFYYKPLQAAYDNPDAASDNLAYFDGVHRYGSTDRAVVSYSIPLMDENGYPYGVLGIELTTDYLTSLIPSSELNNGSQNGYTLVQYTEGGDDYTIVAKDGSLVAQALGEEAVFRAQPDGENKMLKVRGHGDIEMCGYLTEIPIYNNNTPFERQHLGLIGFERNTALYAFSRQVRNQLLMISLAMLLVGVVCVLVITSNISIPVRKLADKVRGMDDTSVPELDRLNIQEVDDLVDSIEELTHKVGVNQVRTEFFSRMSHDMRTPMNAIIGFSSPEMLEGADDARKDDYLAKIHASGSYLLGLINEVLDMTKIESSRMELHNDAINDPTLLEGIVPIIEELAREKQVNFVVEGGRDATWYYGDKQRLSQVVMNLLSNAVKFTPPNGTATLGMHIARRADGTVVHDITVSDTGIGMSEDFLEKMYQPFSQADGTTGGTGLGLSIARQLVELMGGTIKCDSAKGKGTKFTVSISSKPAQAPVDVTQETDSEHPAITLDGLHVLLCEDHPLNTQLATRLLQCRGVIVDAAADGSQGVVRFKASGFGYYDAILMDIRMPVMTGLEAARAIRALDRPDAKRVPILAMTANAFAEDVRDSEAAGMNAHLAKPIDPQQLYRALTEQVARARGVELAARDAAQEQADADTGTEAETQTAASDEAAATEQAEK